MRRPSLKHYSVIMVLGAMVAMPVLAQDKPSVLLSTKAAPADTSLMDKLSVIGNQNAAAPSVVASDKQFSYGASDLSILFLPSQMQQLKEALRAYESSDHTEQPPTFETVETVPTVEKLTEPETYPVFFLSSIAYDGPGDWAVWVSGHKITAHKNDTDVRVISVSRESATFAWQPTFTRAIAIRQQANGFMPTDLVKNKLASAQSIQQDPKTGMITFTLRQNQAFAVGYFKIFEGYIASPAIAPLIAKTGDGTTDSGGMRSPLQNPAAQASPLPAGNGNRKQ